MPKQTINPVFLTLIFSMLLASCLPKEQNAGGAVNSVGKYDNLAGITDDVKITIEDTLNNNRFSVNLKSDPRLPTFKKVSSGLTHTIAIKTDGSLWAWGNNLKGQLGDGTTDFHISPVRIGKDNDWAYVSVGYYNSVALKTDGSLWSWGWGVRGQVGDGAEIDRHSPVRIGKDKNWAFISAGSNFTIAIKTDGSMWSWGDNKDHQLGLTSYTDNKKIEYCNIPTRIGSDNDWAFVSAGYIASLAIKTNGSMWIVGFGKPEQLGTENDWVSAAVDYDNYAAIKKDGTLWIWGKNYIAFNDYSNYLGDPQQKGIDTDWLFVSVAYTNIMAIKTDGSLWAWGNLGYYEDQAGEMVKDVFQGYNHDEFIKIWGDANWSYISANIWYASAIMTDGSLWAWGKNSDFQGWGCLGDGTEEDRYIPVQIGAK
jgi:trimeric autotransporter adhesin